MTRYNSLSIVLHWVMALCFTLMLLSGMAMADWIEDPSLKFNMYQWHKSLGVLLLMAFFVRLGLRLFNKPPALPAHFKPLDIKAAKAGHWALYAAMIVMPLSGWVIVSASGYGLPTIVFNWFTWPHIPGIANTKWIEELAEDTHGTVAWIFIGLIAIHIGAVIKHAFYDHTQLLPRMWWTK